MGAEQTQTQTQTPQVENKVTFGLENVHWSKPTVQAGDEIQYSKPEKMPGSVELQLDPQSTDIKLKADNIDYYVSYSNDGYTGKLVFYNVSEEFLQYAVGEEQVDELIAERSTSQGNPITLMFQIEGDKRAVRHCLTQVVVKRPNVGSATKDGNNFNKVELNFIASPRPNDKVVKYKTSKRTTKETYNKFFEEVKATM